MVVSRGWSATSLSGGSRWEDEMEIFATTKDLDEARLYASLVGNVLSAQSSTDNIKVKKTKEWYVVFTDVVEDEEAIIKAREELAEHKLRQACEIAEEKLQDVLLEIAALEAEITYLRCLHQAAVAARNSAEKANMRVKSNLIKYQDKKKDTVGG